MRSVLARPWNRMLLLGAAAVGASALLPLDTAALVAQVVGVVGMVALVRGARRNQSPDLGPIRLIAAGGSSFLVGNVVREIHGGVSGVESPFPSPADLLYYAGYCLLLLGFLLLVRRRSAQLEGDNLLDTALLATCIGTLALAFVVVPVLDATTGVLAPTMTVLYTVFDVLLLATVVRLAVGSGRRSPAYHLLVGSLTFVALTDIFMTVAIAASDGGTSATVGSSAQRLVLMAAPLAYVLGGAAGLHPSIANLTDTPALRDIQLSPRRLAVLFTAVLGMLALLALSFPLADDGPTIIAGFGTAAAILIVLGRLALLVQANERKAAREAMLRDAAGDLARATSVAAMLSTSSAVLVRLLGPSSAWVLDVHDGEPTVVDTAGEPLADGVAERVLQRASTDTAAGEACAVDERGGPGEPRLVLAVPVPVRRGRSLLLVAATDEPVARQSLYAVETLATQLAGAIEGLLLAEEIYRQEQEQRFRALIEHSSDLVIVLDDDGLVTFASPACTQLLGVTESHLVGRHPFERVHPDDRFEAASLLDRSWAVPGVLEPIEIRFAHVSGEWRWFELLVENLLDQAEVGAVILHTRDITDRRRAQDELAAREARFRSLVQHAADLIAIVDEELRLTYVSPAARGMLGYDPDALVGRPITDLVPADQLFLEDDLLPAMAEAQMRDAGGSWRTVELTITDLRRDPAVGGIVVNARDVSERKTLEGQLRHLAMHDPLTGLANRNLLHDRLAAALRLRDHAVAVLYIDIDDFKALNDTLGHGYGDQALSEVARRLTAGIREGDLAARLGGDEFAVLLEGPGAAAPMEVAERLLEAVRAPIQLGRTSVQLTVSLGAASREADSTVATLTRNADIAMYLAKSDGKDRRQKFVPEMLEAFNERIELKRDLQHVVERGELRLVYQPVYDLATGRMASVEALVRWDHPTRGTVPPLQFIPLAEETGVIQQIGSWVLDQACAQLAAWRAEGAPAGLAMGVNLSVTQLEQEGLLAEVERTLLVHGLEPTDLVLEVTESVLAADVDLVQLQLSALSNFGVRLALDDFGTGYSSLGYLQHFQLDTLKIDKSFLGDTKDPLQQEGLVRAIIDLARNRGMSTVAEGVEEPAQLAMLLRLGCTSAQGYLFAKPLAPEEVLGALGRAAEHLATA